MPRAKQKNCTGSSAGIPGVTVGDEGARYAGGVVEPVAGVDWTRRYSARGSSRRGAHLAGGLIGDLAAPQLWIVSE